MAGQLVNQIVREDRTAIRQRLDLEVPAPKIVDETGPSRPLIRLVDIPSGASPLQQTAEFDRVSRLISARGNVPRNASKSPEPGSTI